MKLPATLFPSLSTGPTTRTAATSGAPTSMFGARPGTAFGAALGAALGEPVAHTGDKLAEEPAEAAGAASPDPDGDLAHVDSERTPALDAVMTQFWVAAQTPATQQQLDAALTAAPQKTVAEDAASTGAEAKPTPAAPEAAVPGGARAVAATAPALEGGSLGLATQPDRQPVDAAVVLAPVVPASAALSAVVPPALPLQAQAPVVAPSTLGGTQQAVPAGMPMLSEQLSRPLFALAAAPRGEHVMTINVVPDALGPVTVRAHLAVEGIRIELMSPSDTGREGLRNILADLRRDLAAGGMAASLSMGSGNGSTDHGTGQHSPQEPGNPWSSVSRPGDQDPPARRRLAPSEVPSAANNSLDITV